MVKLLTAIIVLCALPVHATTYFADKTVASSSTYDPLTRTIGSGTYTVRPTIQEAVNLATSPGDIVEIREGTYDEAVTTASSGLNGSPITHRAYDGERVWFKRWKTGDAVSQQNFHVLDGITAYDPIAGDGTLAAIYIKTSNNIVQNCTITTTNGGRAYWIQIKFGMFNTISNVVLQSGKGYVGTHTGTNGSPFLQCSNITMIPGELATNTFYAYNWTNGLGSSENRALITHNTDHIIYGTLAGGNASNTWMYGQQFSAGPQMHIGVAIQSPSNIIDRLICTNANTPERTFNLGTCDGSIIRRCLIANNLHYNGSSGPHPDIFQALNGSTLRWILLENNRFINNDGQGGQIDPNPPDVGFWIVRGNVWAGLFDQLYGVGNHGGQVYNNTVFMIGGTKGVGTICRDIGAEKMYNNVFHGITFNRMQTNVFYPSVDVNAAWDVNNNYYSSGTNYAAWSSDYITTILKDTAPINGGDPRFVSPRLYSAASEVDGSDPTNLGDYTLQSSSPLINAGIDLSSVWPGATDMNGVPRGASGGWDIGAYEFNGSPTPPPQPGNLTLTHGTITSMHITQ